MDAILIVIDSKPELARARALVGGLVPVADIARLFDQLACSGAQFADGD